jgi:hypothetical protein
MGAKLNNRRRRYQQLKNRIFNHYGWVCKHCKEDDKDCLVLDHIDNNGAAHRRQYGKGGRTEDVYRDAVKWGFPSTYQALCANCNMVKQKNGGRLPRNRRGKYR